MDASFELFRQEAERVRASQPEHADDILDDVGYYTYVEAQYLWQFCLWRMQGILEAVICNRLLPKDKPGSRRARSKLGARLDAVRAAGYTISEAESTELLAWAALRNALSHAPPEQYRPGPLAEEDVVEYRRLVGELIERWLGETERVRGVDMNGA
jgi:hypothetical protein